jgi:hypothetical protein
MDTGVNWRDCGVLGPKDNRLGFQHADPVLPVLARVERK